MIYSTYYLKENINPLFIQYKFLLVINKKSDIIDNKWVLNEFKKYKKSV